MKTGIIISSCSHNWFAVSQSEAQEAKKNRCSAHSTIQRPKFLTNDGRAGMLF